MKKIKYHYNKHSLRYEQVQVSIWVKLFRAVSFISTSLVFSLILVFVLYRYLDSPKEKAMRREIEEMRSQYDLNKKKLAQMDAVLQGLQNRDDNIYRVIFEAEPIPTTVRQAGTGGANRYKELEEYDNSDLMVETAKQMDKVSKQLYIQSKSYDEINRLIKNKEIMLSSIPAIQPVPNKNLTRVASGYGFRIHPIYKTRKMHYGMDFTAPVSSPIYATGDGVVKEADYDKGGFGNHVVIDHGFGYETVYGHMSVIKAKAGQKVKRGDEKKAYGNAKRIRIKRQ